jgi:transcriptional regulator with XRE-family HTH domain
LAQKWSRLVDLRKAAGLTQSQVAEKLNMSQSRLANYEQGLRKPDHETTMRLAKFFSVSVDYLLGHSTESHGDETEISAEWMQVLRQMQREGYEPDQVLQALRLLTSIRKQQEEK